MTEKNKIYYSFLAYILNITNKINIEFQSEKPRVHALISSIKAYFKTILQNFVKEDSYEIHIGAKALLILNKASLNTQEVNELRCFCKSYYVELCGQILRRIDFNDKSLYSLHENMFPNLKHFVGSLLSFPHSSATAERKFSEVNLIKDKKEMHYCMPLFTLS
ncbi:uncharacterized protein LOC118746509 [Rhagoletis pomonella]|uniref:uncharacterized protein LOC118746509 n=1 Tax=Rhagoletis pomonella TaxID=28610 RepID=UPI00177B0150|nr:uncharacterized protein LOC118746509 [Rhagoletis pomonella]